MAATAPPVASLDSLDLKVLQAKNLPVTGKKEGAKAYVRLNTNFSTQQWKTKVTERTSFPAWNQDFNVMIPTNITTLTKRTIILTLFEKHSFPRSDVVLGEAFLSLDDTNNKEIWIPLENEPKRKRNPGHAELQIALAFHVQAAAPPVRRMEDLYTVGAVLGRGGFSVVYEGIEKATGKKLAIKYVNKLDKEPEVIKLLQREISVMTKLKHPNIVELRDVFETSSEINMVLEYVSGGELYDKIIERGYYTERDAAGVIKQLLQAAEYMHGHGVAHRDLKPENLLCEGDLVKIADFGLSKDFTMASVMNTCCGSPSYVAPEVLSGAAAYDCECDIWSIGVIAYVLVSGYLPFFADNQQELFEKILEGVFHFSQPVWTDVSPQAKDFITKTLTLAPASRPNAADCLRHPWLAGAAATAHLPTTASMSDLRSGFNPKTRGKVE
ncbi:calcium/calmodulin-dependent protein kinase type IV [Pelomyxa schiedti]|nr:calcium/calmodulin-dependent protein kinase type IV [Pelomyxa schiedti]